MRIESLSVAWASSVRPFVYDACEFVAKRPFLGHLREDLTKRALRFRVVTPYPNYAIVHRHETAPVQAAAVLHGKRDVRRILKNRLQ